MAATKNVPFKSADRKTKEDKKTVEEIIKEKTEALHGMVSVGSAFNSDPATRSDEELLADWSFIHLMEGIVSERKEAMRFQLLERAEKQGNQTDKGGFRLMIDGTEVLKERREAKLPDEDGMKKLLSELSINRSECFDDVIVQKLNASKLDSLVQRGFLPQDKIEPLKKVTWALKTKPSASLERFTEDLCKAFGVDQKKKP